MRIISKKRRLVESEGSRHAVKRGLRRWLHFENLPYLENIFRFFLRVSATIPLGRKNAADLKVRQISVTLDKLPTGFDNIRILLITDLHIDAIDSLTEKLIAVTDSLDYDFCILGGDYSFGRGGHDGLAYSRMREIADHLIQKSRVFGILGNHDRYSIAELLERCGVEMLINDGVRIESNGDRICLVGLDDCHYYGADDIALADSSVDGEAFKIMVCHSPERYKQALSAGYSLYLAGHTHGGQVCLPGGFAPVTSATVPRSLLKGKWKHRQMIGYTSPGAGVSGVAVRFFCPPEISIITLRKSKDSASNKNYESNRSS